MVNTGGNFPLAGQEAFVKSLLNNYFLLSQFRNHHLSSKHIGQTYATLQDFVTS